jgi:hypothetical protein
MLRKEFEDTKGVIRIHKIVEGQKTQWPKLLHNVDGFRFFYQQQDFNRTGLFE